MTGQWDVTTNTLGHVTHSVLTVTEQDGALSATLVDEKDGEIEVTAISFKDDILSYEYRPPQSEWSKEKASKEKGPDREDLTDAFAAESRTLFHRPGDWIHVNAHGNQIVADRIAAAISARRMAAGLPAIGGDAAAQLPPAPAARARPAPARGSGR